LTTIAIIFVVVNNDDPITATIDDTNATTTTTTITVLLEGHQNSQRRGSNTLEMGHPRHSPSLRSRSFQLYSGINLLSSLKKLMISYNFINKITLARVDEGGRGCFSNTLANTARKKQEEEGELF